MIRVGDGSMGLKMEEVRISVRDLRRWLWLVYGSQIFRVLHRTEDFVVSQNQDAF
jgi:hypothetical protein